VFAHLVRVQLLEELGRVFGVSAARLGRQEARNLCVEPNRQRSS
jgi:hypothetical protein